jgi:hypothetical protein
MESSIAIPGFTFSLELVIKLTLYVVLGAYSIFTGVLYYHWKEYSTDVKVTGYTLITYFTATLPLLAVMGIITIILL